jgi:hypothetical protein
MLLQFQKVFQRAAAEFDQALGHLLGLLHVGQAGSLAGIKSLC